MQKLSETYWAPGMVLAKPVENDQGMVLAAGGSTLTERMIEVLRQRHVASICVEGHPVDIPEQNVLTTEERLAALEKAFASHGDNAFMQRLKELFTEVYHEIERRRAEEAAAEDEALVAESEAGDVD